MKKCLLKELNLSYGERCKNITQQTMIFLVEILYREWRWLLMIEVNLLNKIYFHITYRIVLKLLNVTLQVTNFIYFFIVGFICPRQEVLANGCCNDATSSAVQYSCETCKPNNCCELYEYCISCCLDPDKVYTVYHTLSARVSEHKLFAQLL